MNNPNTILRAGDRAPTATATTFGTPPTLPSFTPTEATVTTLTPTPTEATSPATVAIVSANSVSTDTEATLAQTTETSTATTDTVPADTWTLSKSPNPWRPWSMHGPPKRPRRTLTPAQVAAKQKELRLMAIVEESCLRWRQARGGVRYVRERMSRAVKVKQVVEEVEKEVGKMEHVEEDVEKGGKEEEGEEKMKEVKEGVKVIDVQ